jgi:hypothetical protein
MAKGGNGPSSRQPATSLEVLDLTVERVRALPVLVLITFRPEYEAPWASLSHVTGIALDRLAPAEAETLAERVAGRPLPSEVTAQIVAKTDGVPLFVEELTKAVLEGGLLVEGAQGWRLDGPLPPFAIPAQWASSNSIKTGFCRASTSSWSSRAARVRRRCCPALSASGG